MATWKLFASLAFVAIAVVPTRATVAGEYHWARGLVTASSTGTITLRLDDGSLTLRVDQATEMIPAAPVDGSVVQVHFSESRGAAVAILILAEDRQLPLTSLKHPGRSVYGEMRRLKARTVAVGIDGHTRDVVLNDDTRLVDREGGIRAVGTKSIAAALVGGTKLVVTWKPFWVPDGAGIVNGFYRDAETIRTFASPPQP